MIVIDTSALLAIAQKEPQAQACMQAMIKADTLLISAGTLAELLIVATRRNIADDVKKMITGAHLDVVPVTETTAHNAAAAYQKWGKGIHPAGLNYGDCFAYALANENRCPLLYIGNDFAQTDVQSALKPIP